MNKFLLAGSFLFLSALFSIDFLQKHSETKMKTEGEENPREAYDALTFLAAMDAFPNAEIPKDAYQKAWIRHKQIAAHPSTRTAWQNLGPNNVGGRTISIAIDPVDTNVIWLGSASGGLWKSTVGGIGVSAWQYVPTGFDVLGVGAIAINPSDHNEMYIGTGETYAYGTSTNGLVDRTQRGSFGIGILKTTDGGTTWSKVLDWTYQDNRGVWSIVYNPFDTSIVYAATTEGVYKTTDAGATWTNVLAKEMVMDLVIDKVDTNVVFAAVGNEDTPDKGIYRTQDGGTTWSQLTSGLPTTYYDGRTTLATYDGDHNTLMAIIGNRYSTVGVYKTTDGGDTWTLKTSTDIVSYQGWYAKGLLMKSNDATKVFAGGVGVYKSSNSGGSFNSVGFNVHSDIHDIISNPLDANKIYVVTDGGLFRSKDFGNNFDDCNDGYVTSQHYIGSVSHQDANIAISGLQDNSTVTYSGSVYWGSVIGGDGTYTAIDPNNDNVQYGAYQYLNIYKTTNGWNNYNEIFYSPSSSYGGNPAAFLAPYIICPSNTSVIYAGSSTLYKSTNGGNSFSTVQPDPLDSGNALLSIASSSLSPDTVYFSTAPTDSFPMHVFRSFNGGTIKTDISSGLPNRYPQRITVNPHNAQEVYVVFSGFNGSQGGHIFKSEDAGSTWTDISTSLPDVPFHCLMIDPDHTSNIYAGCDFTIYVSSNGGTDWFTYADGLPDAAMVFDLVLSPSDNSLLAFTYGNGVYKNDLLDDAVGVNEVSSSPSLDVFPNPVQDVLTIKFGSPLSAGEVILFDASGKKILQRKLFATETFNWNVQQLPSGTYFLNVRSKAWSSTQKVMVIR